MGRIVTAEYRSRQFLLEHLNWWQRFTFRLVGGFRVRGNETGRKYLIGRGGVLCKGKRYCLVVFEYDPYTRKGYTEVPVADAMLAKKILIGSAERLFLSTAKSHYRS